MGKLKNNYVAIKAEKRTIPSMEVLESETFILLSFNILNIFSFITINEHKSGTFVKMHK